MSDRQQVQKEDTGISKGFKFEFILGLNNYSNKKTLYAFYGFGTAKSKE